MKCEVSITIVSKAGIQYYFPNINLDNLFDSIEPDENDPEGIVIGVEGGKIRTTPENVHIGISLLEMSNLFTQMSEEQVQAIEDNADDLITENEPQIKIVPDPEPYDCTDCEACSCEKYLVGGEDDGREED